MSGLFAFCITIFGAAIVWSEKMIKLAEDEKEKLGNVFVTLNFMAFWRLLPLVLITTGIILVAFYVIISALVGQR